MKIARFSFYCSFLFWKRISITFTLINPKNIMDISTTRAEHQSNSEEQDFILILNIFRDFKEFKLISRASIKFLCFY